MKKSNKKTKNSFAVNGGQPKEFKAMITAAAGSEEAKKKRLNGFRMSIFKTLAAVENKLLKLRTYVDETVLPMFEDLFSDEAKSTECARCPVHCMPKNIQNTRLSRKMRSSCRAEIDAATNDFSS